MTNVRLPRAVCAIVNEVLVGSHAALEHLFVSCGAPLPAPGLAHPRKWNEWLFRAGNDTDTDSLHLLGGVLEEFMDVAPLSEQELKEWTIKRERVVQVLEQNGFRYYRGGRVLPIGQVPGVSDLSHESFRVPSQPSDIAALLERLIRGLRRAMHPLTHRRKGAQALSFDTEYDVQDLLHALLRPWVADIRPEEYTPSYAGSSTRMDFLLPRQRIVLELRFVRDAQHGKKIGNELIVDVEHYQRHPQCDELWCIIFDPSHLLVNAQGLKDLEGERQIRDQKVKMKLLVL